MTEILMLLVGAGVGLVVGAVYACRKLAGKDGMTDALRSVIKSGPGPWRPPQ